MGVSLAEKLALEGKKVTILTPMGHIAPYMHFTLEAPNMHRKLHKLGVEVVTYHMPSKIEAGGITAEHVYDEDGHSKTLAAEGVDALYRIGDCEAPRLIADSVFSGHRLAREIDSPNPEVPLPFKRERRVPDSEELEDDLRELRERREREAVPA